jgi:NADH-quinone oxidoreductase subunit L
MLIIAVIGALTAFVAATIAIVQTDIKRVLAYSTVSQLGFMFLAIGVGAFTAAVFHLMTHAFFKALLFLGSGSVIHGMHHEQDIRKMGGLKKFMPWTRWTFLIGTIAIAGVPFFSGFFSKDMILWNTLANVHLLDLTEVLGGVIDDSYFTAVVASGMVGETLNVTTSAAIVSTVLFVTGLATALMTAFYMFRLYFLTFEGECRADAETQSHIHESPNAMVIPLTVLAFLSIAAGYIGIPHFIATFLPEGAKVYFLGIEYWLHDVFFVSNEYRLVGRFGPHPYLPEFLAATTSVVIALGGIGAAYFLYIKRPELPGIYAARLRGLHTTLTNKYYVDEVYNVAVVGTTLKIGEAMYWVDRYIIDGMLVNGTAFIVTSLGNILRYLQSGNIHRYATYITLALALILMALMYPGCF